MSWEVRQGDCNKVMAGMEAGSVDSLVCDPPAGISFMGKSWDGNKGGRDAWVAWLSEVMAEALRVCKPGAHALVWALPRTSHWTATALEDAGWEVRDRITHHFGSGFPKSRNLGDGSGTALKPATEDWWLARKPFPGSTTANFLEHGTGGINIDACRIAGAKASGSGQPPLQFGGDNHRPFHDTAEPRDFDTSQGRWPANVVLSHLEECEPVGTKVVKPSNGSGVASERSGGIEGGMFGNGRDGEASAERRYGDRGGTNFQPTPGRRTGEETVEAWSCAPGCPVAELDAQSGDRPGMPRTTERRGESPKGYGMGVAPDPDSTGYGDSGGASRFFYVAKCSPAERNAGLEGFEKKVARSTVERHRGNPSAASGQRRDVPRANVHPTVKPINLMRWLVRLVTPPGGTCLDPFLGSGSTGCAAVLEGFDFIGIEGEAEYIAIAEARIAFWAKHQGREVEDVLGLYAASQKKAAAHVERGQGVLDVEEAAA